MSELKFRPRTPQIVAAWPRMNDDEKTFVGEMHLHYERQFRRIAHEPPESVAAGIHDGVDEYVANTLAQHPRANEVKCRQGCSHCCHINVTITRPEAVLLHLVAKYESLDVDREKLARQAATKDDPKAWAQLPAEDRACVFLDPLAGLCRVYEHRPDACRKYHVLSDPAECDQYKHPGHPVLTFVSIEAEVVASAALNVFESGNLPAMLLPLLEED